MKIWILIASAAEAKLFSSSTGSKDLRLERQLEHPAGRAREQELMSDEPGRYARASSSHP